MFCAGMIIVTYGFLTADDKKKQEMMDKMRGNNDSIDGKVRETQNAMRQKGELTETELSLKRQLEAVQKQNKDLQACFGPQLTGKLKTLTEEAMKAAEKK